MLAPSDRPETGSSRTVVLGFDALSFEYLDEFDLPHFDALRERASEGPLRSTHPPWTASAWPSIYTGTDPSRHGVYDFFHHGTNYPDEARLISREDVDAPALWNYCSARGLPSITLNVPVTYPTDRIDGVSVPGYLAPEHAPGFPEGIREELNDALGEDYRIYSRAETSSDKQAKLAGYLELIDLRRRAAEYLLSTREWRLALIQVQKTDAVFHKLPERDAHRRIYEAADALLGTVLETVEEGVNVIVCSDHGIGPMTGYRIYVNDVLRDHGLLEATAEGGRADFGTAKRDLLGEPDGSDEASGADGVDDADIDGAIDVGTGTDADFDTDNDPSASDGGSRVSPAVAAVSAGASVLGFAGVTPADVYSSAQRLGLAGLLQALVPDGAKEGATERVDWRASRAYCRSRNELGVRVNLRGREPNGVVPPNEYEAVRSAIVSALSELRTPDGRPAFEWVHRREAIHGGPAVEDAADVLFMPNGMDHAVETELVGRRFVGAEGYDHKLEGTFIASGPAFSPTDLDALSLTDVAPAVMASLGQPVPARMTGAVPGGLLKHPVAAESYSDVAIDTGADSVTDDRVTDRLADLGYL